jgi:DNA-binding SARP family transcriptional activator/TolB-like protein
VAGTLRLKVLGRFETQWSDGEPVALTTKKAQALLAYLAVERARPHTRDHLATLLWADTGDERARHNLRQALSKIRRCCDCVVIASGDSLTIDADACEVDVAEFERLARSDAPDELRRGLNLYRGELLEGVVPREAVYEEWLLLARNRLRKVACGTAERLAVALREQNRTADAIEALNDLLAIDPASEPAHRELMELLTEGGRRSDALRQYQVCADALERELGVEPSPETKQLYVRLKKAQSEEPELPIANRSGRRDAGHVDGVVEDSRLPRKLAAILYADVAGYSRLTGEDEDATHRTLRRYLDVLTSTVDAHGGEVVHYAGDAVLARFDAVADALSCAVAVQGELRAQNESLPEARRIRFRIGVNSGDVIEDRGDIYGDGVNVAARLEALAEPGGVCISDAVRVAVGNRLPFDYVFIGEQAVKNIAEPVRAYRVFEGDIVTVDIPGYRDEDTAAALLPPGKPSLVVKPFANISADPEQDYFAEGLTQDIGIALVKIPGLFLTMDESPAAEKSRQMSVRDLGRQFGVRYVLTGGVRKHGNRVRVNAELIESSSGRRLWAERFDRELHDLFAIQDEITEEIVTAMDIKLVQGEAARFMRKALRNPVALETSYRGWHLLFHGTGKQDIREAQHLFEEVIRLEPAASIGYASAALAYWAEAGFGRIVSRTPSMERAAALAREALERGDTTGYANLILALVHLGNHEYEEAMSQATDGVASRPSCNGAYAIKSCVLNYLGRPTEAIEFAKYAVRLTPVYPAEFPAILAAAYHDSGRYEEAIAAAQASLRLKQDDLDPLLIVAASSVALGRTEEGRAAARKALQVNPAFSLAEFAASQPYKDPGSRDRLIDRLRSVGLEG